jgi:gamma-glutamylcyclotransferase (GGCT)/AIG2-like uncharacterized protein YtfP
VTAGEQDRLSVDPEALFVYGTLLFPEILVALIGRVPDRSPGRIAGWRAAALPGVAYPGLVPGPAAVSGRLLTGLKPQEWRVIDAFENGGYDLTMLTLVDGRHGWTYTCARDVEALPEDWSADAFAAGHLAAYVEGCTAWRRRYENRC